METKSSFREALFAPANVIGVTTALSASAITGDLMPGLVAAVAEAVYLSWMAFTRRWGRSGRGGKEAGPLAEMSASQREHYLELVALRDRILASYRRLPGGRVLAASSEQRLDALIAAFARLIGTLNSYRQFLSSADRRSIEADLNELRRELEQEENARLREVKVKRAEILEQRLARFQQAQEGRELVSHQLAGIEDLLRLTHEQSISLRDAESVAHQLEALTQEVRETEETVRALESFIDATPQVASPDLVRVR